MIALILGWQLRFSKAASDDGLERLRRSDPQLCARVDDTPGANVRGVNIAPLTLTPCRLRRCKLTRLALGLQHSNLRYRASPLEQVRIGYFKL